ncbi:MAG: TIGR00366 family protein [Elusimicrobiaceae bacterium]|nr:TIGR00366 family protein [Elusimicrobiaceae bacterium]
MAETLKLSLNKLKNIKLNTTIILLTIIALTAIATWVIPAGKFETVLDKDGRNVLVEGSFHYVEATPQDLFAVLQAPMQAFLRSQTAEIMAFLLIIGGAFMIIEKTGAITAFIKRISKIFLDHPSLKNLYIPVSMLLFSIGGATFGMSEEVLIFIPIFIPLSLSLGYDSMVGITVPFIGAAAGFASAFMNPFTLGIAQGIAKLQVYSGFNYRLIMWVICTIAAIAFVMHYARKIEKNPKASLTYDFDQEKRKELSTQKAEDVVFTASHILVLISFAATMILLVFGVLKYGWYITEIGALFFALGIVAAIFGRLKVNDACTAFYDGVRGMAEIVFLLALATAIIIIAENGNILDTALNFMAGIISKLNSVLASWAAFIMQAVINFFIPSGSSKAVLTMPILAPLSDLIGISRQTMVLAYQFGDGWTNVCIPTSPIVIAVIGMAKIPFQKWFKFILPLVTVWFLLSFAFLAIANYINWQ